MKESPKGIGWFLFFQLKLVQLSEKQGWFSFVSSNSYDCLLKNYDQTQTTFLEKAEIHNINVPILFRTSK